MSDEVKCDYCYSRGYIFFWAPNNKCYRADCTHCRNEREILKRTKEAADNTPPRPKEEIIEEEL